MKTNAEVLKINAELLKALKDLHQMAGDINASDDWPEEMDAAEKAIARAEKHT